MGVGAAMAGLRPVVDIMGGDVLTLVMDQLVNQAA
jgi:pyruvate dehydrogenase E1 component beta subunit